MTNERAGFMSVQSGLLRETLVEDIFARAEERRKDAPPEAAITRVLDAEDQQLTDEDERTLDLQLRHGGYAMRFVEVELFEPARQPAGWIPDLLREHFARTGSWTQAVTDACGDLARGEPVEKPSPDDVAAVSWRVPGPGGHVRHYVARRAIEDYLQNRGFPVTGDPAELKRPWMYGFLVRACEEALPPEAVLGEDT
jgi:hypothetical protein